MPGQRSSAVPALATFRRGRINAALQEFPMPTPSRNTVGVYDRPHPLRTRKVLVPVLIAVVVAIAYAVWWYVA